MVQILYEISIENLKFKLLFRLLDISGARHFRKMTNVPNKNNSDDVCFGRGRGRGRTVCVDGTTSKYLVPQPSGPEAAEKGPSRKRCGEGRSSMACPLGRLNCPVERDHGLPRPGSRAIRSLPGSFRLLPGCSQGLCEARVPGANTGARGAERDARTACQGRGEGAERSAARSRQAGSRRAGAMAATTRRRRCGCGRARWLAQHGCEPLARSSRAPARARGRTSNKRGAWLVRGRTKGACVTSRDDQPFHGPRCSGPAKPGFETRIFGYFSQIRAIDMRRNPRLRAVPCQKRHNQVKWGLYKNAAFLIWEI